MCNRGFFVTGLGSFWQKVSKMDAVDKRSVVKKKNLQKGLAPQEVHNKMSKTLQKDAPTMRTVYRWSNNFRFRRVTVKNEKTQGRPKTVTDKKGRWRCQIYGNEIQATYREVHWRDPKYIAFLCLEHRHQNIP